MTFNLFDFHKEYMLKGYGLPNLLYTFYKKILDFIQTLYVFKFLHLYIAKEGNFCC